jgi:hypothetical protein
LEKCVESSHPETKGCSLASMSRKRLTSRIDPFRCTTRALNDSTIDLNCASVPSSALNANSSDKVSVDTANEGCGIIAPVIIDGELSLSWVTANTLGHATES